MDEEQQQSAEAGIDEVLKELTDFNTPSEVDRMAPDALKHFLTIAQKVFAGLTNVHDDVKLAIDEELKSLGEHQGAVERLPHIRELIEQFGHAKQQMLDRDKSETEPVHAQAAELHEESKKSGKEMSQMQLLEKTITQQVQKQGGGRIQVLEKLRNMMTERASISRTDLEKNVSNMMVRRNSRTSRERQIHQ